MSHWGLMTMCLCLQRRVCSDRPKDPCLTLTSLSPVGSVYWAVCVCISKDVNILKSTAKKANSELLVPRIAGVGQHMGEQMMQNPSAARIVGEVRLAASARFGLGIRSFTNRHLELDRMDGRLRYRRSHE